MMNASLYPSHEIMFLLLIFSFKLKTTISCPEIEKQSLLSFKQSLEDPNIALSSWDSEVDCCKWKGVVCDNLTGHVHHLYLQENLKGKIDPSLVNLKHLRYLDLSQNWFEGGIPSFIGSFTNLEYLNLSFAGFYGKIPHTLGNLSKLHTLDLARDVYDLRSQLNGDRVEWLSGLPKLEYLNMNGANLSRATEWLQVINTLPSLLQLHFISCSLDLPASSEDVINITSLRILDLSLNDMHTRTIPKGIGNLTSLNVLDLSSSGFSGKIPGEIFKLCNLKRLEFSMNELQGEISELFGNMSECFSQHLEILSLDNNHFAGPVSADFGEMFKNLRILRLGRNLLSGAIPSGLGNVLSLEILSLEVNKFSGNLPHNFGQLSNLIELRVGDNMLEGVVSEAHFVNLTKLVQFDASGNHLTLKVAANWIPPFRLSSLELRSWNLGPSSQIFSWLETQKDVRVLDLSNAGISGNIPLWILDSVFLYLNLSHNHLHGNIPHIRGGRLICLSSNEFSGALPLITDSIQELDLSDNSFSGYLSHSLCNNTPPYNELEILHLGGNELVGEIPDCLMQWIYLRYLNLGNNNFHGSIPTSLWYLPDLLSLNLYENNLSGQIPLSLQNSTRLLKLDLSNNHLYGSIPTWIGANLPDLKYLILHSNKFSGEIPLEICNLNSLQILDLSHNTISGIIPDCVDNLTAMSTRKSLDSQLISYSWWPDNLMESASIGTKGLELQYDTILYLMTGIDLSRNNLSGEIPKELTSLVELRSLNLSQNHFKGSIPEKIGDMRQLESLDFSRNSLSGQIPSSITFISSLSYLNLSYNNFTGKIPEGTQLQGFNASSFIANNLCGPPLSTCSHDSETGNKDEDDESNEIEWLYVFISSGFAVGVSIVISVLVLNKSWREAYFELLNSMWDKIFVFVCVRWRRLIKPSTTSSSTAK